MKRFHRGQPVYVGYAEDRYCDEWGLEARCNVGEIIDGPYPPGTRTGSGWQTRSPSWQVLIGGESMMAGESILFPFDDPDTDTEATTERYDCHARPVG